MRADHGNGEFVAAGALMQRRQRWLRRALGADGQSLGDRNAEAGATAGAGFGAPLAGITAQLPARSMQFSLKIRF